MFESSSRWLALVPVLAALFVASCAVDVENDVEGEIEGDIESAEAPIVNGVTVDGELRPVVFLSLPGASCTGTFVHPNYILTAAHCIRQCSTTVTTGCTAAPGSLQVADGSAWTGRSGPITGTATDGINAGTGNSYPVDFVQFAQSSEFDASAAPLDLAVLRTTRRFQGRSMDVMSASSVPTPANVCSLYDTRRISIAGYSNNAGTSTAARRVGDVEVECDIEYDGRVYMTDGHGRPFVGSRACPGDSGGPGLFRNAAGQLNVGGIISMTDNGLNFIHDNTCPSDRGETGLAFLSRAFLDRIAASDPTCARPWDGCVALARSGVGLSTSSFSDAAAWGTASANFETIRYADLDADGDADVCARAGDGIYCALAQGTGTNRTFGPLTRWSANFSDALGWAATPARWSTIDFVDVNGDRRADVCGKGDTGIFCGLSLGSTFGSVTLWSAAFSETAGWATTSRYRTIRFVDVTGDGRADVCGRSSTGLVCASSNGSSFINAALWMNAFNDAAGWTQPSYYETIEYGDLDADGDQDVCSRAPDGVRCALSNRAAFGAATLWTTQYADAAQWNTSAAYYTTIQLADINGDGRADICGRGYGGVYCGRSNNVSFQGAATVAAGIFSDANGWNAERYYGTLQVADWDGDRRADICGRAADGWYCAQSTSSTTTVSFGSATRRLTAFNDADGWSAIQYYRTLRMTNVDGQLGAEVCGRGSAGIYCSVTKQTEG